MDTNDERVFGCVSCGSKWSVVHGSERPEICPECAGVNIHRLSSGGGFGGGRMGGGKCRGLKTGHHRQRCGKGHGFSQSGIRGNERNQNAGNSGENV
ncbi:MAG: hypothetical protein HGA77_00190 [Chlorobiaceae bacterium]|nr:hypothetical protein [Chlorobiaceae bacterium]